MAETETRSPMSSPETATDREENILSEDNNRTFCKSPETNSLPQTQTGNLADNTIITELEPNNRTGVAASYDQTSEAQGNDVQSSSVVDGDLQQGETTENSLNAAEDDLHLNSNLLPVSDDTLDKLSQGFLQAFVPHLETSNNSLDELMRNQRVLIETCQQENVKFKENHIVSELAETMAEARIYHSKLVNIKKEMTTLHERTTKLKKRALKLQQQKMKANLAKEQQREKEMEQERHLIAKPAAKKTEPGTSAAGGSQDGVSSNKPV